MSDERPYPTEYPVEVQTTIGPKLTVDEAEYIDLRRQNLIDFGDDNAPTEPAASSAAPNASQPAAGKSE